MEENNLAELTLGIRLTNFLTKTPATFAKKHTASQGENETDWRSLETPFFTMAG
jgi:hypothetical protein